MRFLQFGLRACVKQRNYIRQHIYLPWLWEIETVILAEVIAMPKQALEAEVDKHRNAWDLKSCIFEARQLSDLRSQWQTHSQLSSLAGKVAQVGVENMTMQRAGRRGSVAGLRCSFPVQNAAPALSPRSRARVSAEETARKDARTSHPLMEVIDKYRLPDELRNSIAKRMLRESVDRWWIRYQEYKEQLANFKILWQQWRLDVAALGPLNRHVWPLCPAIPAFPRELTKVDEKWLHSQVVAALRHTQAGKLL
jgi:hypothetical protein